MTIERRIQLFNSLLNDQLILLFTILFLGSILGRMCIKGISLGSSGILLVAMVFGHFGYQVSETIQQLGLSLFIVAVGLQAGPRFFRMMRTSGVVFGLIGLLVVLVAAIVTVLVSKMFHFSPALSIGLMTGALTSTPGLAAAIQATNDPLASVGYGIAYPFGAVAVVLFVQLVPRIFKVDFTKDLAESNGPIRNEDSPELMIIQVTNLAMDKRTLKELKLHKYNTVISRIIRGSRNIIALNDTVILGGDRLVAIGGKRDLERLCRDIGVKIATDFTDSDHIQVRKVIVDSDEIIGKSIEELELRKLYGVTVTRIERGGLEYNQKLKWRLERGDVLTIVSRDERLDEVETLFNRKHLTMTNIHILSLSFILLVGVFVGMMPIHLPGLGTITFGVAGGPLFVALIIGHFGKLGPIHARYFQPSTKVVSDIGLVLFLAGAGTTAGQGIVEVVKTEGLSLIFGGTLITLAPIFLVYFLARKWFRLGVAHSLGALCGGMTSTPGLGAVSQLVHSEEPAIAYAAAYPFALIIVAITSQLLVFFL